MAMVRLACLIFLTLACASWTLAQDTNPPPAAAPATDPALTHRPAAAPSPSVAETIVLAVPKGTPLQVALEKEVRIQKVGQPVRGRVVEAVYSFDKIVIPVGTEVAGKITKIEDLSTGKRTAAVLDADFTPARKVQVEFDELSLADGRRIPIHTIVTPGSGEVIQFVTAADEKKTGIKDSAAEKVRQAKEEAKREWAAAMKQVKEPDKMHRIERFAVALLPVHPNYIDAGTVYFAELQEPLDFGTEPMTPETAASINTRPPPGSLVHARLLTALSSATTPKGAEVDAIVTQPLFDGKRLILPQGSLLKGSVVQVQPARHPSRNGQLRMVFHDLVLPDGIEQKVDAVLEGIQAGQNQNLKLDSESGAEARPAKTRFPATAASVGLGAVSFLGDTFGDAGPRVAGGAGGYKLIGIALGLAIHSQEFGIDMFD
jgi:type IV secretory pathway VirB10-like protein